MHTTLSRIVIAAGLAGAAGCAASGGGPGAGPDATLGAEDLVDDLEDGDDAIAEAGGRMGGWYTFNDATAGGTQTPPESGFVPSAGGAGGSAYAATTAGEGFTEWGAGMGFDLNNPAAVGETGERGPYDTSRFRTLAFQARGNVAVRVALQITAVTPLDAGGTCTPSATEGMECEDLHGSSITLTGEWKEYQLPLDQMRPAGLGPGRAVRRDRGDLGAVPGRAEPGLRGRDR